MANSAVSCSQTIARVRAGGYVLVCVVWKEGTNNSEVPAECTPLFSEMFIVYNYICNVHFLTVFIS